MHRDKLAKVILLTLIFPLALYIFGSCILNYIPPTESYKKTPKQFESLFNEQMAQYGMSIDIDDGEYTYGNSLSKTVPIICEDGSKINCIYYPTSEQEKAFINYISFEQEISGIEGETIYLEQIFTFLLDNFETVLAENKDVSLSPISGTSYNEAIDMCRSFITDNEKEVHFFIFPEDNHGRGVEFKREADEMTMLSVSLQLS